MVLLGNRTIEKSIAAVKCREKLFENVRALLQGLLGGRKVESLVTIGIRAENARMPRPGGRGILPKQERLVVGMDEPLNSLESLFQPPLVNGEGQPKASGSG
jgi:hypothetical protein